MDHFVSICELGDLAYLIVSYNRDLCFLPRVSLITSHPPDVISVVEQVQVVDSRPIHMIIERKANDWFEVWSSECQYGSIILNSGTGTLDINVNSCPQKKRKKRKRKQTSDIRCGYTHHFILHFPW